MTSNAPGANTGPDDGPDDATHLWDSPHWAWSPDVQDRMRAAVQRASVGEVVSYGDTMLAPGNMLVSVDLTVAAVANPGGVHEIVCSVVDPTTTAA